MITKENLKDLLLFLGYENTDGEFSYHFKESNCEIIVDFNNEIIIYPTDKGLIVNERQTTNFSYNENFVVLECIHRLLEKGYLPSHIEIEKRWSLGHLQKSGRADICVMNATGNDILFIIECKTYGDEFDKELKTLKSDGGQLFSYYQQEKSAKWLMLYAANYENKNILHQVKTVPVFDTEEVLEKSKKNKHIDLFENASSKEKAFETWVKTYDQKIYADLIFSEDTIAYNIGEKPLRKKDLKEFNPRDKIVNKFEEILRHNNVSDKENAFNKLTALFICKLVDEITKDEDDIVDFQYKFGTDTYETLLDRLQRLYKEGMDKFMKEEIFYVSSEYPLNLFSTYKGQNRKNAIEDLKDTFRKLKFYSNSDFAFKDVHNEELFLQNGKILVEVVKLFEHYRIVYSSKHQFLGDLFEQLLNQGFKQNEGQFFTPIPITRFIWESLPIENLKSLSKADAYPKVIDYACGSGHFLTEGIDLINKIKENSNNDWVSENIYGIEKDYRLARVSKISLFMNGAGEGNIIFGDGLDNHKEKGIKNESFDILVANPPYSVKAFKSHLNLKENSLELLESIKDGGEIEVLFVERISQLIKANGIAAVILPSSILSNSTPNSYVGAREIILKNFKIKAISQFGEKTFGKTDTNTVVLFLQKYNEPPKYFKIIEDNVQAIFNNQKLSLWKDDEILDDYIEHIGVDLETYTTFIEEIKNYDEFEDIEYFKMYLEYFNKTTELKNLINRATFKKLDKSEQIQKINSMFYSFVKEIEKDKIFYFALVKDQKTLIINFPSSVKERSEFLGYSWSESKGNEGIQIKNVGGMLYDPINRESNKHIAPFIRKTFDNSLDSVAENIKKYSNLFDTKNMLDFQREKFDKSISLTERKIIKIKSTYKIEKLGKVCKVLIGGTPSRKQYEYFEGDNLWVSISEMNGEVISDTKEKITDLGVENSNVKLIPKDTTLLSFKLSIGKVAIAGKDLYTNEAIAGLIPLNDELLNKYIFYLFKGDFIKLQDYVGKKAFGKSLNSKILKNDVKIPIPPIAIQEKIIYECDKLEEKYENTRMKIEDYNKEIQKIFEELEVIKSDGGGYRLSNSNVFSLSIGKRVLQNELTENGIPVYSANVFEPMGNIDENLIDDFSRPYIVWGIDGDWMVNIFEEGYEFYPTDHCGFMTVEENKINPRYMAYLLEKAGESAGFSRSYRASIDRIKSLMIDVPNIEIQNQEMKKVYELEEKIRKLDENQIDLGEEISNILNMYLQ